MLRVNYFYLFSNRIDTIQQFIIQIPTILSVVDKASGDADRPTIKSTVHVGQSIFPSILCTAFVDVIGLLDDHAVSLDGTAVYEVAYQVKHNFIFFFVD